MRVLQRAMLAQDSAMSNLPQRSSIMCLASAHVLEQNDVWRPQPRYLLLEGLQTPVDNQPARLPALVN